MVVRTMVAAVAVFLLSLSAPAARAQSNSGAGASVGANPDAASEAGPEKGGHEFEVWSGGGPSVAGGIPNIGVWNAGVRYGWVLTNPHGPSFLRGRLEAAVDAVPIFWVFQPGGTAYGMALDPLATKWNFATHGRVAPYVDIDGCVLFTTRKAPPGASSINFTPSMAIGAHFLRHKYNWTAEVRFLHISDASLTTYNPGINTVEVRVGFGMFTHKK